VKEHVMDPKDQIEVVRAIYSAMAERDIERLLDLIDEGCTVDQDPSLPWGGHHVGHDGFGTFALTLAATIDSAVTIEAIFAADGDVIQYGRTKGTVKSTGVAFDIPEVHRWTVRDGKAIAARMAIDTPAMLEALAAEPGASVGDSAS
jgi:ketosteroid isomerase-like protein